MWFTFWCVVVILFCFSFFFSCLRSVLCPVLQCLWIVYSLLPHRISLTFICYLIHFRVRIGVFNATFNNITSFLGAVVDEWCLNLQLLVQSWAITSNVVISKKCAHGKVYLILHSVIKFVSDLWQVGGFLWVLWFPPPIKLTATI
jgi:hypothetical protein